MIHFEYTKLRFGFDNDEEPRALGIGDHLTLRDIYQLENVIDYSTRRTASWTVNIPMTNETITMENMLTPRVDHNWTFLEAARIISASTTGLLEGIRTYQTIFRCVDVLTRKRIDISRFNRFATTEHVPNTMCCNILCKSAVTFING